MPLTDEQKEALLKEVYLGDGLYASFDGWNVVLRAPQEETNHFVYLEPSVLDSFQAWLKTKNAEIVAIQSKVTSDAVS